MNRPTSIIVVVVKISHLDAAVHVVVRHSMLAELEAAPRLLFGVKLVDFILPIGCLSRRHLL